MQKLMFKILLMLTIGFASLAGFDKGKTEFHLSFGTQLRAFDGEKIEYISSGAFFYTYGWIDAETICSIYQPEEFTEASAIIEFFDISESRSQKIVELGGTGESCFAIHPTERVIAYNDYHGVKIMKFNMDNTYTTQVISPVNTISVLAWIDDKTLMFKDFTDNSVPFGTIEYKK